MDDPFEELRSLTFDDWDEAYTELDAESPLAGIIMRILVQRATITDQWLSVYAYAADAASIERAAEQIRLTAQTCQDLRNVITATTAHVPLRAWAVERFEQTTATFAEWQMLVPFPVPGRKLEAYQTTAIIHLVRLASTFDEWDAVRLATQYVDSRLSRNAIEMMANCARSRAQWQRIFETAREDSPAFRLATNCLRRMDRRAKRCRNHRTVTVVERKLWRASWQSQSNPKI